MHDRHGNEIHLRDVVKVAANEYLPEMHGPHAFAAGQMLLPVAKYGLVIALYPAATSCNVCVALR